MTYAVGSTLRGHDCKEGCLCSKENEGKWNEMNPDCPVTGHRYDP